MEVKNTPETTNEFPCSHSTYTVFRNRDTGKIVCICKNCGKEIPYDKIILNGQYEIRE